MCYLIFPADPHSTNNLLRTIRKLAKEVPVTPQTVGSAEQIFTFDICVYGSSGICFHEYMVSYPFVIIIIEFLRYVMNPIRNVLPGIRWKSIRQVLRGNTDTAAETWCNLFNTDSPETVLDRFNARLDPKNTLLATVMGQAAFELAYWCVKDMLVHLKIWKPTDKGNWVPEVRKIQRNSCKYMYMYIF